MFRPTDQTAHSVCCLGSWIHFWIKQSKKPIELVLWSLSLDIFFVGVLSIKCTCVLYKICRELRDHKSPTLYDVNNNYFIAYQFSSYWQHPKAQFDPLNFQIHPEAVCCHVDCNKLSFWVQDPIQKLLHISDWRLSLLLAWNRKRRRIRGFLGTTGRYRLVPLYLKKTNIFSIRKKHYF